MADKKGALAKRLSKKRDEIRIAEEVVKNLKEEFDGMKDEMLAMMKDDGIEKASIDGITVSVQKTNVAQVTDWDKFYRYLHKNKKLFMLQKRVSDKIYREELELRKNRKIPGVETFTRVSLGLRAS